MIRSKADLAYYLDEDRKAYGKPPMTFKNWLRQLIFTDYNWAFMRNLRKLEYYTNCTRGGGKLMRYYLNWRHSQLRHKTGIELNVNVAAPGLHITHGKIVVSPIARIGEYCKIMSDVTIGIQGRYDVPGAPTLGNRVWVGSGAKIIGPITIADDVVIGANAVVAKSITEPNITVAGIPAKKVSDTGSYHYLNRE